MRKTESVWIPFFQVKFGIQLPGIPIMIIHLFFRRFQITEILYLDGVLRRGGKADLSVSEPVEGVESSADFPELQSRLQDRRSVEPLKDDQG